MASDFLARILAAKRREVEARKIAKPLGEEMFRSRRPGAFRRAFAGDRVSLIAEIKRASPSKGPLRPDLSPADLARAYETAGAAAVSVVTDHEFFGGSLDDLREARAACRLPLLRKDFVIDPYQVLEAAEAGADAVLLIVAALPGLALGGLMAEARAVGLDSLVEVHDARELEAAQRAGATIIGINNRDLATFQVDPRTVFDLLPGVARGVLVVAESSIRSAQDVLALREAGVRAILVGEALVTAPDPGARIRELMSLV